MSQKKVVIIGAGLAGLSTGIYARLNGYETHIFEHGNQPGGVSATWKRKGFTIDGGVHFYMGYRPGQPVHDLYRELGIDQADQYREMEISRFFWHYKLSASVFRETGLCRRAEKSWRDPDNHESV